MKRSIHLLTFLLCCGICPAQLPHVKTPSPGSPGNYSNIIKNNASAPTPASPIFPACHQTTLTHKM